MVLVLLGSQPRLVLPVLQAAHDLDVQACILLGTAATRPLRWSMFCQQHVLADYAQPQQVARQLREIAQEHHCRIVEAIASRSGTRAEMLAREHSQIARRAIEHSLHDAKLSGRVPGATLISFSGAD